MASFPGALASFIGFVAGHTLLVDVHGSQHNLEQAEIVAVQTKVGIDASTPSSGKVLRGTSAGHSSWGSVDLTTDVTGVLPTANLPVTTLLGSVYPVGSIYTETTGTNPGTTFGFGTWSAYGQGRVLVGNGSSDQAFAAGATGGESNHALTSNEMPSHTHTQNAHSHSLDQVTGGTDNAGNLSRAANPGVTVGSNYNSNNSTAVNQNTGGSATHNNLQPYIVVYIWQRTA